MEPLSLASFTLAGILSTFPTAGEQVSQAVITTHISPAIAGQWEIDLERTQAMSERVAKIAKAAEKQELSASKALGGESINQVAEGIVDSSELRIVKPTPDGMLISDSAKIIASQNIKAASLRNNQCRELYNFGADNEMLAVSGKELTYGRYLITHREEGLPIIAMKTTYDNNQPDCSGNQVDQTDDALIAFLKHDGNNMQWCADSEGEECFMDFNRVLP